MGGHNIQVGCLSEDSDICERINTVGWDTQLIAQNYCVSIQHDTVSEIAEEELLRNPWESRTDFSLGKFAPDCARRKHLRMERNVAK